MTTLGYNNRYIRLVKDLVFVAIAIFIAIRGRVFGLILGLLFGYWYGRDAYYQFKAIWQEKRWPKLFLAGKRRKESMICAAMHGAGSKIRFTFDNQVL